MIPGIINALAIAVGPEDREKYLIAVFKQIEVPLSVYVMDLRSSVCKEAISLIVLFANKYPAEFAYNSNRYINSETGGCLFR